MIVYNNEEDTDGYVSILIKLVVYNVQICTEAVCTKS